MHFSHLKTALRMSIMTSKMNRVSGQGHIASESAFSTHVFGNGDEDSTAW